MQLTKLVPRKIQYPHMVVQSLPALVFPYIRHFLLVYIVLQFLFQCLAALFCIPKQVKQAYEHWRTVAFSFCTISSRVLLQTRNHLVVL